MTDRERAERFMAAQYRADCTVEGAIDLMEAQIAEVRADERREALAEVAAADAAADKLADKLAACDDVYDELDGLKECIREHLPAYVLDDGSGDEANPSETVEYAGDELRRLSLVEERLKAATRDVLKFATERDDARRERDEARAKLPVMREAIGHAGRTIGSLASAVKSGEPFTATLQGDMDIAGRSMECALGESSTPGEP